MSDGRVEAVFEGDKEKVDEMVEYCHSGPPAAKVSSVEVIKGEYTGVYTGFSIRR
jgi:acylphosphatase